MMMSKLSTKTRISSIHANLRFNHAPKTNCTSLLLYIKVYLYLYSLTPNNLTVDHHQVFGAYNYKS